MTAQISSSTTITVGPIVLNSIDVDGVKWTVDSDGFDGWGVPSSSLAVVPKATQPGGWAGASFTGSRPMALRGLITAPTPALLTRALDALFAAVSNEETLFQVAEAGATRWCIVRRSDDVIPKRLTNQVAMYAFRVTALDHRKFSVPLTASTRLPVSSGGLTVPFTAPFAVAATLVSGQVNLTNPGNETGPVILRVDGPCHGPSITHVASGISLTFSASLVLGEGEWLTIDPEARTVMANDQSSRSGYITSRGWFGFVPGDNTFAFTASSFDAGALLTVTATPAFK